MIFKMCQRREVTLLKRIVHGSKPGSSCGYSKQNNQNSKKGVTPLVQILPHKTPSLGKQDQGDLCRSPEVCL